MVDLNRIDIRWIRDEPCKCGVGNEIHAAYDSRSIFLTLGCKSCLPEKLSGYRDDVLYGPTYETEEQIEEID